jgi:hypothetical protein
LLAGKDNLLIAWFVGNSKKTGPASVIKEDGLPGGYLIYSYRKLNSQGTGHSKTISSESKKQDLTPSFPPSPIAPTSFLRIRFAHFFA